MMVLPQVVVVELDEALDGLLHRAHLDQSHLAVLPVEEQRVLRTSQMFFSSALTALHDSNTYQENRFC